MVLEELSAGTMSWLGAVTGKCGGGPAGEVLMHMCSGPNNAEANPGVRKPFWLQSNEWAASLAPVSSSCNTSMM